MALPTPDQRVGCWGLSPDFPADYAGEILGPLKVHEVYNAQKGQWGLALGEIDLDFGSTYTTFTRDELVLSSAEHSKDTTQLMTEKEG